MRREPGERPKLALVDGGLSAEEVERRDARRHHPANRRAVLEPVDDGGPVAG